MDENVCVMRAKGGKPVVLGWHLFTEVNLHGRLIICERRRSKCLEAFLYTSTANSGVGRGPSVI